MKTKFTHLTAILISGISFAQVGINTASPKTTLDVSATRDTSGVITNNTQTFGLQAPRLTRAELTANTATYGTNQTGALIYITDVTGGDATGQRINVTAMGYYYFDGTVWQRLTQATNAVAPAISTLQCTTAYLSPSTYTPGTPYTGNLRVTYSGGNGGAYNSGTPFTINGLTFQLRPGTLEFGDGELVFSVSGTPTTANDMTIPMTNSTVSFLTAAQNCTATVGNSSRADIAPVAAMGYPTLTTDSNGKQAYTFPLATPDGKYSIRVIFDTTSGTTAAIPNVQLFNNTGSTVNLYWNYNTEYGGYIGAAQTTNNITSGVWGGMGDATATWFPQGTGAVGSAYWGNVGIIDGSSGGPEHRRYTWIDSNASSKTAYTATIMAGAPTSGSAQPNLSKIYIKIEQVKAQ
ncbi:MULTISPECIES: hypothetical protein [Chryseobacterium]|uniref:Uncharacterized protein n=1 Tax=Chryseobacterium cucumeris TaxID=1813611 RepID=A0ABX9X3P4_9FLAO|nr:MULTISPECIES: hypothetical protein [Chryseobacterium]KYH06839.1 hypothetical protein A1704_21860 [Chryseobacterium cucumeris]MDH5032588.1 hypothetical protein [Chryseobacterium cucumeris]QWT86235.1 hypothetical protein KBP46_22915 [Chryseobacterium sp. PCH239]RKE82335.1 hypothetical protein DEU39_1891 [Chryseobacterium sp. AG363]ROH88856.1 hypothetical protein EGI15_19440 [Chryseobacterium cucumeris]